MKNYLCTNSKDTYYGAKRHSIYNSGNYTCRGGILPDYMAVTSYNYTHISLHHLFVFKGSIQKGILKTQH